LRINFGEFIGRLNDANLLYKVIQKVRQTDLEIVVCQFEHIKEDGAIKT